MPNKKLLGLLLLNFILLQESSFSLYTFPPDTIIKDTVHQIKFDTIRIKKTILVYDTVRVYDTIIKYDSTSFPVLFQNYFSVSTGAGMSFQNIIAIVDSANIIKKQIEISESDKISPVLNIAYGRKRGKWTGQVGFNLLWLNQYAGYKIITTDIQTNTQIDSIDNSYWQVNVVDTFYEVNGTDSTLQVVADSSWVSLFQTDTVVTYDTLTQKQAYTGKNRYVYFRIPFIIKYAFWKNTKWSLNAGSGFIVGFLARVSGKTLSEQNLIQPIETFPPLRTNFFLYTGMQLAYKLTKRIYISTSFSGELMLKPLFPEKNIKRKTLYFGAKAGILYNF